MINSNLNQNKENIEMKHSSKIHTSYSLGSFFEDFLGTAFSVMVFFFYDNILGMDANVVGVAYIIFGIWNMINDPFAGYISDKPHKWTKKWGKRFPIFMITIIPCALLPIILFIPNIPNEFLLFLYLVITICVFDMLFSFWNTNWLAIFPNKFRSQKERTQVGAIQTVFSQVGVTVGMLLPMLLCGDTQESYIIPAIIISVICFITAVLMIPSMRETKEEIQFSLNQPKEEEPYLKTLKFALKQKHFIAYLVAYLGQSVMMTVMLGALPYFSEFVLQAGEESLIEIFISAAILIGGVVSVPLWTWVGRKYGNRVGYLFGTGNTAIILCCGIFFGITDILMIIFGFILGFSMGATWTLIYPTFSDVIDDLVVKMKKRKEGIFYGFRTLIGRLSIVIEGISFGIIFTITDVDNHPYEVPAQWGIRFAMMGTPMIFYALGFLFMWKVYGLKPDKVKSNKEKMKELGL
ncbi:MAG: MFS transporter [archaeon]|nr:MFS transporter [archaeon]